MPLPRHLVGATLALACACNSSSATAPTPDSDSGQPHADGGVSGTVGCQGCLTLVNANVFDPAAGGGNIFRPAIVVIRSGKIDEVLPAGRETTIVGEQLDLGGRYLMPGLIDTHVHIGAPAAPNAPGTLLLLDFHLRASLRNGVTTLVDLGSPMRFIAELQRRLEEDGRYRSATSSAPTGGAFAERVVDVPRMISVGPFVTLHNGHPCNPPRPNVAGDTCVFVDPTPAGVRAAFDKVAPKQLIKITMTSVTPGVPAFTATHLDLIVAEAARRGVRVIAHVGSPSDMRLVIEAGIKLLAHVPFTGLVDDALAALAASAKVKVIPTLATFVNLPDYLTGKYDFPRRAEATKDLHPDVLSIVRAPTFSAGFDLQAEAGWGATIEQNFKRLLAHGVAVAAGTDAGNILAFHGVAMHDELARYVSLGMTKQQALIAATRGAADAIGRVDLGRIAAGAAADLLVLAADPTAAAGALRLSIDDILLAGRWIDRSALAVDSTPTRDVFNDATTLAPYLAAP